MDQNILEGRKLIETYRSEHSKIYEGILTTAKVSSDHEALHKTLIEGLQKLGFKSIDEFFDASYKADDDAKTERWG